MIFHILFTIPKSFKDANLQEWPPSLSRYKTATSNVKIKTREKFTKLRNKKKMMDVIQSEKNYINICLYF